MKRRDLQRQYRALWLAYRVETDATKAAKLLRRARRIYARLVGGGR